MRWLYASRCRLAGCFISVPLSLQQRPLLRRDLTIWSLWRLGIMVPGTPIYATTSLRRMKFGFFSSFITSSASVFVGILIPID